MNEERPGALVIEEGREKAAVLAVWGLRWLS